MQQNSMPKEIRDKIFEVTYRKADEYGYTRCDRAQSGIFMDMLLNDPEVGGILVEYMPKERVRTYIKDTILNNYTKAIRERALVTMSAEDIIESAYGVSASLVDKFKSKGNTLSVLRAEDGRIFVVSDGTAVKWETALRKALEFIAGRPSLVVDGNVPSICLNLLTVSQTLTVADTRLIQLALGAVGVKAVFCDVE